MVLWHCGKYIIWVFVVSLAILLTTSAASVAEVASNLVGDAHSEEALQSKAGPVLENSKPFRVFTFSLNQWNPIESHRRYSVEVDLQQDDVIAKANHLCTEATALTKAYDGYVKCMIPAIQSMRWKRAIYLGQAALMYESYPHASVLFALDFAYESDRWKVALRRAPRTYARRLCVLGAPLPHVMFAATMLTAFDEVFAFFPDKALHALEKSILNHLDLKTAKEFGSYFNTTIHYYSVADAVEDMLHATKPQAKRGVFQQQCDVIHILPDVELAPTSTSTPFFSNKRDSQQHPKRSPEEQTMHLLHYLSRQKTTKNKGSTASTPSKSIARIVWNQLHPNATAPLANQTAEANIQGFLRDAVDWQLSNTWFCVSYINQVVDRNGFYQKAYFQHYSELLMTVRMGVLFDIGPTGDLFEGRRRKLMLPLSAAGGDRYLPPLNGPAAAQLPPSAWRTTLSLQKRLVIVITCMNRILIDTSIGLQEKLKQLGYDSVHVVNEFNLQTLQLLEKQAKQRRGALYQISMAPSDIELYAKHYTVFNCEQAFSLLAFQTGRYRYVRVMEEATTVWTYFDKNQRYIRKLLRNETEEDSPPADELQSHAGSIDKVYLVPFYYTTHRGDVFYKEYETKPSPQIFSPSEEDHAWRKFVFFFGSGSLRRVSRLHQIRYRVSIFNEQHPDRVPIDFLPLAGSWDLLMFDYERDYYVHHAKIMLNIGLEDSSTFEMHRVNYLLSFGKLVISERGQDPSLEEQYQDVVVFVDSVDEMVDKVLYYLDDAHQDELKAKQEQARQLHLKLTNMLQPLEAAMLGIENILLQQNFVPRD